jgi:hypothetical protein
MIEATKQTVTEGARDLLSLRRAVWSLLATARASTMFNMPGVHVLDPAW